MATATKETAKAVANAEEMVKVKLPLTREKQDDVFVSLNGVSMKIQRGKEVEVPASIFEVLKNSEDMDALALERSLNMPHKE